MTDLTTGDGDSDGVSLPAARPDPALTLPTRRVAGSPRCLNCDTELAGPFCHYCGQPDRNFLRFFPVLLREFLEDFLDLDSRIARTLKPLLFQPGRLTRDYLGGRRYRYTPPMRLYLFSSIAFFLLAALLSTSAIDIDARVADAGDGIVTITTDTGAERQRVDEALAGLPEDVRSQIDVEEIQRQVDEQEEDSEGPVFQFNDERWDRETNPVDVAWLPGWFNEWINDEIERSPEKTEQIKENPRIIVEKVFDLLPATMFVLLPVVALLFKFWYLFARRYYIEHLIFALHNHAFIFTSLILALLLGLLQGWLAHADMGLAASVVKWLRIAIFVWIPVYLLLSLRRVYRQHWVLTLGKFAVIGISYVILLGTVSGLVAILGFLLL